MAPPLLWAEVIAGLFLAILSAASLQQLTYIVRRRAEIFQAWGRVTAPPLNWFDFLLYCSACLFAAWKFPSLLPATAVGGAVLLFSAHQASILQFWNWKFCDLHRYLLVGLRTYFAILLPFLALTWISFAVFLKLGYNDTTQPVVKLFLEMHTRSEIIGFLVLACIIAPLWEEIVFRGMLYPFLKHKTGSGRWGPLFSMFFCAGFWSAIHQHPPTFIPLLVLGLVLTAVYETTGQLGYCIGLHSVFNSSTCLVLLAYKYGPHH